DFYAYLEKCGKLLSKPRLHKCLRFGGIIWRLAMLFLNLDGTIDAAPSPDALNHPQEIIGGEPLIDDGVTKEELNLLIGAFKVSYEQGNRSTTQYSYWPPHHIWMKNGCNVGAWTPDNEDWF
ncbi:hypothetical protein SCHPADRAFT_797847, partial [Schizopora paradoxa]